MIFVAERCQVCAHPHLFLICMSPLTLFVTKLPPKISEWQLFPLLEWKLGMHLFSIADVKDQTIECVPCIALDIFIHFKSCSGLFQIRKINDGPTSTTNTSCIFTQYDFASPTILVESHDYELEIEYFNALGHTNSNSVFFF